MREALERKIRNVYFEDQLDKLRKDEQYLFMQKSLQDVIDYEYKPMIIYKNGKLIKPKDSDLVKGLKFSISVYIQNNYPVLAPYDLNSPIESIDRYIKLHSSSMRSEIMTTDNLSLSQIDKRLQLFKVYLGYSISHKAYSLIYNTPNHWELTFDEWLFVKNYNHLVKIKFF